jgi:hypothetical protein
MGLCLPSIQNRKRTEGNPDFPQLSSGYVLYFLPHNQLNRAYTESFSIGPELTQHLMSFPLN